MKTVRILHRDENFTTGPMSIRLHQNDICSVIRQRNRDVKAICTEQSGGCCFAISGEMSTSGNVFRLAASDLEAQEHIFVVDSANLSTGIGLLVIEAAIMAQNGRSAKEIVDRIEKLNLLSMQVL